MEKVEIGLETDAEFKAECDELFAKLGISTEEAISVFLHQAVTEQGFPFIIGRRSEPSARQKPILWGDGEDILEIRVREIGKIIVAVHFQSSEVDP